MIPFLASLVVMCAAAAVLALIVRISRNVLQFYCFWREKRADGLNADMKRSSSGVLGMRGTGDWDRRMGSPSKGGSNEQPAK